MLLTSSFARRVSERRTALVLAVLVALLLPAATHAQRTRTTRVPVGAWFLDGMFPAALSDDARFLAYMNHDPEVTGGPDGYNEIFIHDLVLGTVRKLNIAPTRGYTEFTDHGMSGDGRFLVFHTTAKTLVPNDTTPAGTYAVFLYDRQAQTFERIRSSDPSDPAAYSHGPRPTISADGRFVAFTGPQRLIYLHDRVTGETRPAVRNAAGAFIQGDYAVLNANNRFIAFVSYDSLVAADTNGLSDIYVYDRSTDALTLVSVDGSGAGAALFPSLSSDGRFVAYAGGSQIWVRDRDTDRDGVFDEPAAVRSELVSMSDAGVPGDHGGNTVHISASGRTVSFKSYATNLLGPGVDTNDTSDVYAVDFDLDGDGLFFEAGDRRIARVSVGDDGRASGQELHSNNEGGAMARDGRIITFASTDDSFFPGDNTDGDYFLVDRQARSLRDLAQPTTRALTPQPSGDGTWVTFASADASLVAGDTNGLTDVFVRDRRKALNAAGAVVRVSVATSGAQSSGGNSDQPGISSDGRFIVFRSAATNLVTGDTNAVADIYLHDRDTDQDGVYDEPGARSTVRVSVATGGLQSTGGGSETPRISGNGRYVTYASLATNLSPGASAFRQVYRFDRLTGVTLGMSERDGAKANADAVTPTVSNAGVVAFATAASNLSSIDANGQSDVYTSTAVWPYSTPRTVSLISQVNGAAAPGASSQPAFSPGGRLAFVSTASLAAADTNGLADVYLLSTFSPPPFTSTSNVFLLLSRGAEGVGNGASSWPTIGERPGVTTVAFTSGATNLVFRDLNGVDDVFRVDVVPIGGTGSAPRQETLSPQSRISLRPDGLELTLASGDPSISADGTHIEYAQTLAGAGAMGGIVAAVVTDGKVTGNTTSAIITGIWPNSGPEAGGTTVELAGTGLADPELVPHFNGVSLQVLDRGPDFIRARTPAGVGVVRPGLGGPAEIGKSVNLFVFTYLPAAGCALTAGPPSISLPSAGGPFTLSVTDAQSCGWSTRSTVDWIGGEQAGTGNQATVQMTAQPNTDTVTRHGQIVIGGASIEVSQAGSACAYDLAAAGASVGADATTTGVLLQASAACGWTVTLPSQQPQWLSVVGSASGTGSYDLRFGVAENNEPGQRTGVITVGGRSFTVTQAGEAFFTLRVAHSVGGRVTSQPAGIDCGPTCTAAFGQGSTVLLTPIADQGYAFDGWNGDCSGQNQCSVVLAADRDVTALFREVPLTTNTLTVSTTGAGVVTSSPAGITCEPDCAETFQTGTTVTLTPAAASGWRFAGWSGGGCGAVVQMTANRTCAATFERVGTSTYTLSIAFGGSGGGRVTSAPAGIDCTANCSHAFAADTTIVLTPASAAGSTFSGWSGDPACSSGAFQLTQPLTCVATFQSASSTPQTLTVGVIGNGRVVSVPAGLDCAANARCSATFAAGTVVQLVAVAQAGHTLQTWGNVAGSGSTCQGNAACKVRMRAAAEVVASFVPRTGRPIDVASLSPGSGPASGGTKLRLRGSGFQQPGGPGDFGTAAANIVIGGVPAVSVDVISDTEMIAVLPAMPTGATAIVAGLATVVATSDVTINVNGSTDVLTLAWRTVALDGSPTTDTDSDGLPDQYEAAYSLDPLVADAQGDADGDGATNLQEYQAGTHPQGRYTRYLAEGATGSFFDTRIAIANPLTVPATTLVRFQTPSAVSPSIAITVPGETRRLVYPSSVPTLASADFGTVVESDVQLAVDRQMFWNPTIYGSHAGTSVDAPSTTWYLAEGATHGRFDLFYLLQNPGTQEAAVRIRYLRPSLPPLELSYTVPARQRRTIYVDEIPELRETDVSAVIESTNGVPIIVERSMYVTSPTGRAFEGGHESAGVTAPSTHWFLAEGATGAFFDTYVLIANPSSSTAAVRADYLLPNGSTVVKTYSVPANSRSTIWVDGEDPRLAATSVSTIVTSTNAVPIIVERSMWWPGIESVQRDPATFPILWGEAHNSPGSTETGTAWVLADGDTGPAPVYTATYILIANTSAYAARVRVTLLSEIDLPPLSREYDVPANGRFTVPVGDFFPETQNYGFGGYGSLIESVATQTTPVPAQIVVERAMYSNSADGLFWAAGTNILAMKLR